MEDIIADYNKNNLFGIWMEMDFQIDSPGEITYKMEVKKHHQAVENVAHGGMIAGMMDGVIGVAALSSVASEGKRVSTVEFKINYLNPVLVGDKLTGRGKVLRKGKRLVVSSGEISNEKGIVATALGTFMAYPVD
ncbi:MAG: hypothetical protein CL840_22185 [Crocinitomicaceae bacterium]|nr:hypothetical protein [Crocinitomicaceae bacterium]|tara:strand:+ start:17539 stop:17943 length:405 start_codon:yes stop_codon:yes gene_type:complete